MKQNEFSRKSRVISVFAIVIIVTIFIDISGISKVPSTVISGLLRPIQIGLYKTKIDFEDFVKTVVAVKDLRQSEKDFKVKNATLLAENAKLKKLGEENQALKSQLGFRIAEESLILASIIGIDPKFLNSQVLLDVGSKNQVKKGNIVKFQNILLGKISSVNETSSTLTLLSDPSMKIPAVSQSGVRGLVGGSFGNTVKFSKIPTDQKIRKNELVFSSGESGYPKNLVLGKVGEIEKNPSEIFQEAKIVPLITTQELKAVFVVKEE